MERYGELFIFSKTDESKIIRLNVENFVEKGVLDVYLNEKRIGSYEITKSCEIVQQVKLRKGENILRLVSRNGCIKPITLGIACDERCLSFKLKFKV